jgi:uncharacterized integral membrane protein
MASENENGPVARGRGDQTKRAAGAVAGVIALLFAALNFDEVDVNWVVDSFQTPLIIVIAVSFVLGAGVGALAMRGRGGE